MHAPFAWLASNLTPDLPNSPHCRGAKRGVSRSEPCASDVAYFCEALSGHYKRNNCEAIAGYSAKALARVWKAERFSWQLTKLMHRFPEDSPFERRMQIAELDYIASSTAAHKAIAENYVGLPI